MSESVVSYTTTTEAAMAAASQPKFTTEQIAASEWSRNNWTEGLRIAGADSSYTAFHAFVAGARHFQPLLAKVDLWGFTPYPQPTPLPPAGAETEPAKYDAPELEIVSRDRQIAYLRHQVEQLEATVAELKGHHQRDEETIVQRTDELRVLSGDYRELLNDTADVSKDNISLRFQLASADGERKRLRTALEGVLNSAVHPDIALRAVMVDLIPIRSALGSTPPTTKKGNT